MAWIHYRSKFQSVEVKENSTPKKFLEAWQRKESIHVLFSSVHKYALSPITFYKYKEYIRNAKSILEYGCGLAPITYSAIKYGKYNNKTFIISDIKQYTYHYAKWRLQGCSNIKYLDIEPRVLPKLKIKYDLLFIQTVLEHLPNPLKVIEHLYKKLHKNGYIIFDYIKSSGHGLDTKEASKERPIVLDFIKSNFVLIKGKIDKNNSMGTTIVRKK